ncbi:MAG: sodium-independent anion transporter, partial [Clostridia bacterium]|nr:sodium-independent anion transporter [Clostridia bacterium]
SSVVDESRIVGSGSIGDSHRESIVVYITGTIFFANANTLISEVQKLPESNEIIFSLRGVPDIDTTGIQVFTDIYNELHCKNIKVLFCGMNDSVSKVVKQSGLYAEVGAKNFYWSVDKALLDGNN